LQAIAALLTLTAIHPVVSAIPFCQWRLSAANAGGGAAAVYGVDNAKHPGA
jgi:hypothetical protein